MVRIKLGGVNTSVLLEFLGLRTGLDWKRTWSTNEFVIGVFEFKPHLPSGDAVIVLVVENDNHEDECNIWMHPHGIDALNSWGLWQLKIAAFWHTLRDDILELADKNEWFYEVEKASYRGKECPYCFAIYVYKQEDYMNDGMVLCQNCGKPFLPPEDEPQRNDNTTDAYPTND
jgi:hypothetical protein